MIHRRSPDVKGVPPKPAKPTDGLLSSPCSASLRQVPARTGSRTSPLERPCAREDSYAPLRHEVILPGARRTKQYSSSLDP